MLDLPIECSLTLPGGDLMGCDLITHFSDCEVSACMCLDQPVLAKSFSFCFVFWIIVPWVIPKILVL